MNFSECKQYLSAQYDSLDSNCYTPQSCEEWDEMIYEAAYALQQLLYFGFKLEEIDIFGLIHSFEEPADEA